MTCVAVSGLSVFSCCESRWKGGRLFGVGNGNSFRFKFCNNTKKSKTLITAGKSPYDKIPKQFREKNLKEGVMENFKNFPSQLYGLSPSELDFFSSENSPLQRQAAQVTEESLSSAKCYREFSNMQSLANSQSDPSRKQGSLGSFLGGMIHARKPRTPPPDLPSYLLASRVVWLCLPIVPAVAELIHAELMYLDSESSEPIYIYINSVGTLNKKGECIAPDSGAFQIADCMGLCNCRIYTLNLMKAYGVAAMLLALGHPGYRFVMPHAVTKIHLPRLNQSVGPSIDMHIEAKELEIKSDKYIHFLSLGTGKSKEEIARDLKKKTKLFFPEDSIDYGLVDKILPSGKLLAEERTYGTKLDPAKIEEMRAGRSAAPPMTGASAPPVGRP